jgi:quercetin dioxygenase-like cupin family protein
MTATKQTQYTFIPSINDLLIDIQPDSITSRSFYKGESMNAILFGFDAGQELSEHTSSKATVIQIIQGEATITLGGAVHKVTQGAWIQMPPHLKHSVYADTPLKLLLMMFNTYER